MVLLNYINTFLRVLPVASDVIRTSSKFIVSKPIMLIHRSIFSAWNKPHKCWDMNFFAEIFDIQTKINYCSFSVFRISVLHEETTCYSRDYAKFYFEHYFYILVTKKWFCFLYLFFWIRHQTFQIIRADKWIMNLLILFLLVDVDTNQLLTTVNMDYFSK